MVSRIAMRVGSRGLEALLVGALLMGVPAGVVRAQTPCDKPELKKFIAGVQWPRHGPMSGTPQVFGECVQSLERIPQGKNRSYVLGYFGRLRSGSETKGVPSPEAVEAKLFRGESPRITREFLHSWRLALGVPESEARFEDPFYQSLLGALALVVLDRSDGLDRLQVEAVRRLQRSMGASRSWPGVEQALLWFRLPLWGPPGSSDPILTVLRERAASIPDANLASAEGHDQIAKIAAVNLNDVYWVRVDPLIKNFPAPRLPVIVQTIHVPAGCTTPCCAAAIGWNHQQSADNWERLRQSFRAASAEHQSRFARLRERLPVGIGWSVIQDRMSNLTALANTLSQSAPQGVVSSDLDKGLETVVDLGERFTRLEVIAACRGALTSLLRGDASRAEKELANAGDWRSSPRLAAVYFAARYWRKGPAGLDDACRQLGSPCITGPMVAERRQVEQLLGLKLRTLEPPPR